MGERHGIGPWRRSWSIFRGRLCTQGTVGVVCQTRERFGLTGAFARRLDGLGGYLVSDTGWTGPEVWQHETQPAEDQHHELRVDVVRNHRIAPLAEGVRGSFYPVFRPHELSAAVGYTTPRRGWQRPEHCPQSFVPRITRQHVWVGTPGHYGARIGSTSPYAILLHRPYGVLQEYACSPPGHSALTGGA